MKLMSKCPSIAMKGWNSIYIQRYIKHWIYGFRSTEWKKKKSPFRSLIAWFYTNSPWNRIKPGSDASIVGNGKTCSTCNITSDILKEYYKSSPFDMIESRLGLGWNPALLRCWWEEGRMRAANALFTKSPSTVPIRTSEFVIADLRAFNRLEGYETEWWLLKFLWRLQRKEPGWFVGEHRHVLLRFDEDGRLLLCFFTTWPRGEAVIDLLGEIGRSIENLTVCDDWLDPPRFTRVGEADLWTKLVDREEKLEVDEAKAEEDDDAADDE